MIYIIMAGADKRKCGFITIFLTISLLQKLPSVLIDLKRNVYVPLERPVSVICPLSTGSHVSLSSSTLYISLLLAGREYVMSETPMRREFWS